MGYGLPILYAGIVYAIVRGVGWGPFTTQNIPAGQSPVGLILINATIVFLLGAVAMLALGRGNI